MSETVLAQSVPCPPSPYRKYYPTERLYRGQRGLPVICLSPSIYGTLSHYYAAGKLTLRHDTESSPCPACLSLKTTPRWMGWIGGFDAANKAYTTCALTWGAVWHNLSLRSESDAGRLRGRHLWIGRRRESSRSGLVALFQTIEYMKLPDTLPEFPLKQIVDDLFDPMPRWMEEVALGVKGVAS